jgi:hypothetical protein
MSEKPNIRHVAMFAKFLGRSPDTVTAEDVRRYQVHLTESGVQPPTLNSSASALRFFFGTTPRRTRPPSRPRALPRKLPRVLSPEEVGRPLRPPRQRRPIGEPGEGPQAAGRVGAGGDKRGAYPARCRVGCACHPVSLLRRAHGCHRDVRGGLPTATSAHDLAGGHRDRHLVTASPSDRCSADHRCRWSSGGCDNACLLRPPRPPKKPRSPLDRVQPLHSERQLGPISWEHYSARRSPPASCTPPATPKSP